MIIAVIGGIGSGKSLSTVKYVHDRNNHTFANFHLRLKNTHRLRKKDIIEEKFIRKLKSGRDLYEKDVNWDFWTDALKKYGSYDIVIDEIHNIFNSRRSMSKENIIGQKWIAQIRKILSNNEKNDLVVVSQRLSRIDVSIRDLLHKIIYCKKRKNGMMKTKTYFRGRTEIKLIPKIYIMQYHFNGSFCVDKYEMFLNTGKGYDCRTYYLGNPYLQFYDSYELLDFMGEYL